MVDIIAQIWIMIFGCSAIWFVGRPEKWSKWGFVLGMLSQPAWYITAYLNGQWGIMILSLWYTYSWAQGLYYKFYKKEDT